MMKKDGQSLLIHLFTIGAYGILTVVFTYPLITHFTTHLLGDGYDGNQFPIALWWVKTALTKLHTNPFYTDYLYYPFGASLVFHNLTFLNGLLGIPLQALFGLTATQNLLNLLTFVLSAYGMFLLADYLIKDKRAALISGLIFGFCPYRVIQAIGFYHMLGTQWLPFYLLFLFKLTRETTWRNGLWAGIFLLFTGWTEYNYGIFLAVFTGIYLGYLLLADRQVLTFAFIGRFAICLGVFLLGFAPILFGAYQELATYGDYVTSDTASTDLLLFFIPSILNPLFKAVSGTTFRLTACVPMYTVYLGYSVLALTGLAYKSRGAVARRPSRGFWVCTGAIFFLLSLGAYLQINGVTQFHLGRATFSIPLPFLLWYKIPLLGGSRVPARFASILMLALAVLSGYGCAWLFTKIHSKYQAHGVWLTGSVIAFVIITEYLTFPFPHLDDQYIPPVYTEIAKDPEDCSILQIPLNFKSGSEVFVVGSAKLDFYQVAHQKRLIGGYLSRVPNQSLNYFAQMPILKTLIKLQEGASLTPEQLEADRPYVQEFIRFLNLKYIVVHSADRVGRDFFMRKDRKDVLNAMTTYLTTLLPLEKFSEQGEAHAYKIISSPAEHSAQVSIDFGTPAAHLYMGYDWSKDEVWEPTISFNWAKQHHSLVLLRFADAHAYTCTVRVIPFVYPDAPQQTMRISLNGTFVQQIPLQPAWATYPFTLPGKQLQPGINRLTFEYAYAHSPLEVLGTNDIRVLAVAFDRLDCVAAQTSLE